MQMHAACATAIIKQEREENNFERANTNIYI